MLILYFSVSLQIKAKNYDKVEKVSPTEIYFEFYVEVWLRTYPI